MTFQLIDVREASYTYDADSEDALPAVRNLRFQVLEGEHLAILGRNGSGKSTLARLLNALLLPQTGRILVLGMDTGRRIDLGDSS
ncbi:MAG: ATP-binding cassette domain-containing protein [Clostridiaceae bacterium]|nr:ATP-binding cassette domain-containing protein [Clostridiaceae bacterium]